MGLEGFFKDSHDLRRAQSHSRPRTPYLAVTLFAPPLHTSLVNEEVEISVWGGVTITPLPQFPFIPRPQLPESSVLPPISPHIVCLFPRTRDSRLSFVLLIGGGHGGRPRGGCWVEEGGDWVGRGQAVC